MRIRHSIFALVATGFVLLAGCGSSNEATSGQAAPASTPTTTSAAPTTSSKTTSSAATSTKTSPRTSTKTSIPSPPADTAAPPTDGPAPDTSGTKPWRDLTAGECIGDVPDGTFTEVTLVDCATAHEAEAIGAMRAVTLQGRPAEDAAQAQCDQELASSGITAGGLVAAPIVETQGTLLARAVCLVVDAGGAPLTGSVVNG